MQKTKIQVMNSTLSCESKFHYFFEEIQKEIVSNKEMTPLEI